MSREIRSEIEKLKNGWHVQKKKTDELKRVLSEIRWHNEGTPEKMIEHVRGLAVDALKRSG